MLTCPDEFISKVTLSHEKNRTQGQRAQLLGRKKQAEEAACGTFQRQHVIMFSSPTYLATLIFFPLPPTIAFLIVFF